MENVHVLRGYGLFDAKVPRYTSYPPANRFEPDVGRRRQTEWLSAVDGAQPVSVYVHIPFCRRLCWFCACRTQGTTTLRPVDEYLTHLQGEVMAIAAALSGRPKMARLHLGGGTPTLLTPAQMRRLLGAIFLAFPTTSDFEFSVEIDPTEAHPDVITELAQWNMSRASIGVQDFDPKVQEAIGRRQSIAETERVVQQLRDMGVDSLNIDLLYGLPFQTPDSLMSTLEHVTALEPDRIAMYGYAHVPHVSKRQIMIPERDLPSSEARYRAARQAGAALAASGFIPLGLDHFALPHDRLAKAAAKGTMKRNFQGYTDDPCATLLGFGASAISTFQQGYLQNAVSTAAYQQRIHTTGLAAHKGYQLTDADRLRADMIGDLMCNAEINSSQLGRRHPGQQNTIQRGLDELQAAFPQAVTITEGTLRLKADYTSLSRLMAARIDNALGPDHIHSQAI